MGKAQEQLRQAFVAKHGREPGPADTGPFALEENGDQIADLMRRFLRKHAALK